MASDQGYVDFIVDQMSGAGEITYIKMFGEYGVYCDGKIMALICDNQLFIKPTEAGRAFIGNVTEAPPYPGAKNYFLIDKEDPNWLCELVRLTTDELPEPKVKKGRRKRN